MLFFIMFVDRCLELLKCWVHLLAYTYFVEDHLPVEAFCLCDVLGNSFHLIEDVKLEYIKRVRNPFYVEEDVKRCAFQITFQM
jgi:hypothetical protein